MECHSKARDINYTKSMACQKATKVAFLRDGTWRHMNFYFFFCAVNTSHLLVSTEFFFKRRHEETGKFFGENFIINQMPQGKGKILKAKHHQAPLFLLHFILLILCFSNSIMEGDNKIVFLNFFWNPKKTLPQIREIFEI